MQDNDFLTRLVRMEDKIGRVDDHIKALRKTVHEGNGEPSLVKQFGIMGSEISEIKKDINEIKASINSRFVTREEFQPIRNFVFGIIGLTLVGVFSAILTMVIKK